MPPDCMWFAGRGVFLPPYWVLVIIAFFTCNAQTFFETGAMVTSIRNFDTERYLPATLCIMMLMVPTDSVSL